MVAKVLEGRGLGKQVVERIYLMTTNIIGFYQQLNFIQQSLKGAAVSLRSIKRMKRFELSTLSLARRCSTTELHPQAALGMNPATQ